MSSVTPPRRAFTHIIIILGACVMLVACTLAFFQQKASYSAYIKEGKENTARLTSVLAGYVDLSFLTVDMILHRASDKQYFNALFGSHLKEDMAVNFRIWMDEITSVRGMIVTDDKGIIKHAFYKEGEGNSFLEKGMTVQDQRYFIAHKMNNIEGDVQISPLAVSKEDNKNYILMSRSIIKIDGSFGGIIAAIVDVELFTTMLRSVELSRNTSMVLVLDNGGLLAQAPLKQIQNDFNIARFISSIAGKAQGHTDKPYITEEEIADVKHIISFRHLAHLPVTVSLLATEEDMVKNWRINRNNYIMFLGVFALFIAVISFLALIIGKQVQKIERSEKMARRSNINTSKFITKMNYEMRTPLNTIIGFSEMIHLGYFGVVNEKQKERIYDIFMCGTYLLEFIHDILDVIQCEEGKLILSESNINISPLLETVLHTVTPYAKKEGVNVLCEDGIEMLPEVKADERKLRQSLLNLVRNMVKYTPSGGRVAISGEMDMSGNLIINVISKGITINPEDFSLAFSMTGQLNSSDNEGGCLGLPLCKIFIERHGGQIKLYDTDGDGIKVCVILPSERIRKNT